MPYARATDTEIEVAAEPPREGLLRAIRRAQTTVDEESDALANCRNADHGDFRRRKDLCLLDLSRRASPLARPLDDPELAAALRTLKDSIIRNQKVLRCQVSAARSVSALIMKAIAEEDSDSTYSASYFRTGRQA